MALEIARGEREGIILLDLKGRIMAGDGSGRVPRAFEYAEQAEPESRLLLNMLGVDYVDSTGLGAHGHVRHALCDRAGSPSAW